MSDDICGLDWVSSFPASAEILANIFCIAYSAAQNHAKSAEAACEEAKAAVQAFLDSVT